jgi:Spy/CpxP family protein refolding chaperone
LNLSSNQAQQIQSLDSEWKNRYEQLQPTLMGEQRQLAKLLAAPKSDPLEITSTQQHINLLREQLSGYATTTYHKTRRLLTPDQQREVEGWLKTKMAERMAGRPD